MLRQNAGERLSATDCLKAVSRIRQNAPLNYFGMHPATPVEAMSSSVRTRAMRNAGYQAQTDTAIWRPKDEVRMLSKSNTRQQPLMRSGMDILSDEMRQAIHRPEIEETTSCRRKPLEGETEHLHKPTEVWKGYPSRSRQKKRQRTSSQCHEKVPSPPSQKPLTRSPVHVGGDIETDFWPGYVGLNLPGGPVSMRRLTSGLMQLRS